MAAFGFLAAAAIGKAVAVNAVWLLVKTSLVGFLGAWLRRSC